MQARFKYCVCLLLFIFLQTVSFAQNKTQTHTSDGWTRLATADGEFSLEMPSRLSYLYDKDGFAYDDPANPTVDGKYIFRDVRLLNSAVDNTYLAVEIYRVPEPRRYMEDLIRMGAFESQKVRSDSKDLTIKRVTLGAQALDILKRRPVYFEAIYAATQSHIYIVTAWSRDKKSGDAARLIGSVRFGSDGLPPAVGSVTTKTIESLPPKTLGSVVGQMSEDEADAMPENSKLDLRDPDSMILLSTPWSGNIQPANNMVAKGKVILSVNYGEYGFVSYVRYISGLKGNSGRNAIFALLRNKFLPALHDGKPIALERKIVFQF